jgi:hypothetical protein
LAAVRDKSMIHRPPVSADFYDSQRRLIVSTRTFCLS